MLRKSQTWKCCSCVLLCCQPLEVPLGLTWPKEGSACLSLQWVDATFEATWSSYQEPPPHLHAWSTLGSYRHSCLCGPAGEAAEAARLQPVWEEPGVRARGLREEGRVARAGWGHGAEICPGPWVQDPPCLQGCQSCCLGARGWACLDPSLPSCCPLHRFSGLGPQEDAAGGLRGAS